MQRAFKNKILTHISRNEYTELKHLLQKVKPTNTELTTYLIYCAGNGGLRSFKTIIEAGANPLGFEYNNEPFFKALTSNNNEILSWYYHTMSLYKIIADFIYNYNRTPSTMPAAAVVIPVDNHLVRESSLGEYELMCCPMDLQSNTQKFFKNNISDIHETDSSISVLYKLVCLKY